MHRPSVKIAQAFAAMGHFQVHVFMAYYFVVVLALETEWRLPYHELIGLWTLGSLLVGVGSIPAGWLADRVGARTMLSAMFLGLGLSSIACGFAQTPLQLTLGLAAVGLFASIYHPVGIAWLIRSVARTGQAISFNAIFGAIGVSAAGIITGALIDVSGWRAAFIVPGAVAFLTGLAFMACVGAGLVGEGEAGARKVAGASRAEMVRGFLLLVFTIFCSGLVFQVMQAALPKVFEQRLGDVLGAGTLGVGSLVAAVYGVAGIVQYAGGRLADRFSSKHIYVGAYLVQAPLLFAMAQMGGWELAAVAAIVATVSVGLLPAENIMLARFTPERHRGLAFGMKYLVTFGVAPLALQLLGWITGSTGGFVWVFAMLGALAAATFGAALLLPGERVSVPAVAAE